MNLLDPRQPVNAWTHGVGLALALPAAVLLLRRSRGDLAKQLCFLIYGLSLAACYAASMLFHGVQGPPPRIDLLKRLDLAGIYLLIAGTYTPPAWFLLRGRWRTILLGSVWLVSASAALTVAAGFVFPRAVSNGLYLGLGWTCLACYFEIARVVPGRALAPMVAGGLFYSVGAVINLVGWPSAWPGVFGPHELFHVFVVAGSAAHFRFMLEVIAPFDRAALDRDRDASRRDQSSPLFTHDSLRLRPGGHGHDEQLA
jgi:hemolysin III